jgi:hypothetical protein
MNHGKENRALHVTKEAMEKCCPEKFCICEEKLFFSEKLRSAVATQGLPSDEILTYQTYFFKDGGHRKSVCFNKNITYMVILGQITLSLKSHQLTAAA